MGLLTSIQLQVEQQHRSLDLRILVSECWYRIVLSDKARHVVSVPVHSGMEKE